ncbi:MAG: hypothetical protein OK455_06005 [Thaumarchaeota archaeon]|nr:hypothetical protein [Nitrososphaerota archaeon]
MSNSTATFKVIYRSATTIKVNTTFSSTSASGSANETFTAWILKNGTAIAVYANIGGHAMNYTTSTSQFGLTPSTLLAGAFSGFYEEIEVGGNQGFYASATQYFHSTGTSSVTIGSNHLTVTNYALNAASEAVLFCGSSSTYTTFVLQIGTPTGTNFPLVTNLQLAGSTTSNGNPTTFSYILQLTAFSLA